ncbi:MAG: NERD domain-containing protein, partial [Brachybacterium sp.]|uniref:nuclease-related domain-containing protein n=1 Tax=Brachybacterium sp. TaxID=1891286 RepID=UPI0026487795
MSGTVYGTAGGSVEDLGTDAARAGRAGEESTGLVLDRITVESQRDVWHDLDVPARGIVANIDHIVTGGTVA